MLWFAIAKIDHVGSYHFNFAVLSNLSSTVFICFLTTLVWYLRIDWQQHMLHHLFLPNFHWWICWCKYCLPFLVFNCYSWNFDFSWKYLFRFFFILFYCSGISSPHPNFNSHILVDYLSCHFCCSDESQWIINLSELLKYRLLCYVFNWRCNFNSQLIFWFIPVETILVLFSCTPNCSLP